MPVTGNTAFSQTPVNCTACGLSTPADGIFCPECGTALPKPLFKPAPKPKPAPAPAPVQGKPRVIRETLLGYTGGTSDKQYLLTIMEVHTGEYVVTGKWGRRNQLRESTEKYRGPSGSQAQAEFDKVLSKKTGKGYRVERNSPR